MSVTVRRPDADPDVWATLPGETHWVDYAHLVHDDDLVVYVHSFRRVRDRFDDTHDVLFWKPSTTKVARRYADGQWDEVVAVEQRWPPAAVEQVPRRQHNVSLREDRRR